MFLNNLTIWFYELALINRQYQDHVRGLNAYDRHKKFVNDYG